MLVADIELSQLAGLLSLALFVAPDTSFPSNYLCMSFSTILIVLQFITR